MSRINLNKRLVMPLAGMGLAAMLSLGCSSAAQQQAAWSTPADHSASANAAWSLAAADGLGRIVFGGTPTVAEPKLPANWMLAEASKTH